jgi:hypothetical protein
MASACVHTLHNTITVLSQLQSDPSYRCLVAYGNHGMPVISVHVYTVLSLETLFCKYFHKVHIMEKMTVEVL